MTTSKLIEDLYRHMMFNEQLTEDTIKYIRDNYSECIYNGEMYRLLVLRRNQIIDEDNKYYSFSKFKDTCMDIVTAMRCGIGRRDKTIMLKKTGTGIDLIKLCRTLLKENISDDQKKDLKELINSFIYEYEIVSNLNNCVEVSI